MPRHPERTSIIPAAVTKPDLRRLEAVNAAAHRRVWNVLAFPITLHTRETGVVLTARILERKSTL